MRLFVGFVMQGHICSCSGLKSDDPLYNISCTCQTKNDNIQAPYMCGGETPCLLDINFTPTEQTDEGTYILELDDASCTFVIANVTVKETAPLCTIRKLNEDNNLKLSCEWIPRHEDDEARIIANNRTLCWYKNKGITNDNLNISNSISTTIPPGNIFDRNMPNRCVISQFGVEKSCSFGIPILQTVRLTPEHVTNVDSTKFNVCCTKNENITGFWWQDNEETFTFSGDSMILRNFTLDSTDDYRVMIICSDGNQGDEPHHFEKIIFESNVSLQFSVSLKIVNRSVVG